jgi:hypothetical protein
MERSRVGTANCCRTSACRESGKKGRAKVRVETSPKGESIAKSRKVTASCSPQDGRSFGERKCSREAAHGFDSAQAKALMAAVDGSASPFSAALNWGVQTGITVLGNVMRGGPKGPTPNQEQVLTDAGYTREQRYRSVTWTTPDGRVISNPDARIAARDIVRSPTIVAGPIAAPAPPPVAAPPSTSVPGIPPDILTRPSPGIGTGGSVLDDLLRRPWEPGGYSGRVSTPDAVRLPNLWLPPVTAAAVLLAGLLWPSTIKKDPRGRRVRPPKPKKIPKGPTKRPRIRRLEPPKPPRIPVQPRPEAPTGRAPDTRWPGPVNLPEIVPNIPPLSLPAPLPVPAPRPAARPLSFPSWMPGVLPFVLPMIGGSSPRPIVSTYRPPAVDSFPGFSPLTASSPRVVASPLTNPFGGSSNDNCKCTTNRKPRKKSCSNPIVSKRKRSKDGRNFITTTREIKCPV